MAFRVCLRSSIRFTGLVVACLLTRSASAQSSSQSAATTLVGTWRGTSVCLVHPSACNDEVVVYLIARMASADSLSVDARKIVRGEEQDMGVLSCYLTSPQVALTCAIPKGIWHFRLRNDSLVGELWLPDNTRFRDVRTVRAR